VKPVPIQLQTMPYLKGNNQSLHNGLMNEVSEKQIYDSNPNTAETQDNFIFI
jgi:hypothetical protein